jgi:hypothetical protein
MNAMKRGKTFTQYTDNERAWMILNNHPVYQTHKEIMQSIQEECEMLDNMSELEREQYFTEIEKTDGEW